MPKDFSLRSDCSKTINIYSSMQMQINSDDQYTKLICKDCTTELLMVAKFRWKCKTSEGTLCTLLTDAMEPSDLHDDDSNSLPDDKADLHKEDENDELPKPTLCIEQIASPIVDNISELSVNEYDDADNAEDGESKRMFLKRDIYEEIEYLQSNAGKM